MATGRICTCAGDHCVVMTEENAKRLRDNYLLMLDRIVVKDIIGHLYSKQVVTSEDRERIMHHSKSSKDQVRCVLEILQRRPNCDFDKFVEGLRKYGYNDVAESLEQSPSKFQPFITTGTPRDVSPLQHSAANAERCEVMSEKNRGRLRENHVLLVERIQMKKIVQSICKKKIITDDDREQIMNEYKMERDQVRSFLSMLECRPNDDYYKFIDCLMECGYSDLAEELEHPSTAKRQAYQSFIHVATIK